MISERELLAALPHLRRYAIRLCGSRDWEDLVQQTACIALEKEHLYEPQPGKTLRSWLMTIMHNLFVNRVRDDARHAIYGEDYHRQFPEIDPGVNLRVLDLAANLAALSPLHRQAVIAASLGHDYEEMSEELRLPVGTVRSRLSRGRRMLRELEDRR